MSLEKYLKSVDVCSGKCSDCEDKQKLIKIIKVMRTELINGTFLYEKEEKGMFGYALQKCDEIVGGE